MTYVTIAGSRSDGTFRRRRDLLSYVRLNPSRLVETSIGLVAVATMLAGVWALLAPRSFYDTVATFPPYNTHLIHDIGAFQIGLGGSLAVGLLARSGLLAVLAGNAMAASAHFASHLLDRSMGGRTRDPVVFGVIAAVGVILTVLSRRITSDMPLTRPGRDRETRS